MITVMVTGAGSGIGMSIIKSLVLANHQRTGPAWHPDCVETGLPSQPYSIVAADCSPLAPGLYAGCCASVVIPPANGSGYKDALMAACERWRIDVLIPGCEPELKAIAAAPADIEASTGTRSLVSPWWSVRKMRDKVIMADWLAENGFWAPKTSTMIADNHNYSSPVGYPYVAKPRDGSGSVDTHIVKRDDRALQMRFAQLYCAQEYLEGDEFTTSVLVGLDGVAYEQMTLRRLAPKIGEGHQFIAREVYHPPRNTSLALFKMAADLCTLGCCNIQWKFHAEHGEHPVPFEINMRFPGSTIICAAAGMNGPDLAVSDLMGEPREPSPHRDLTCLRHLSEVFVPKDGQPFTMRNLSCASVSPEGPDT